MNFNDWIDTLNYEKGIDIEARFDVEGPSGTNNMDYHAVVSAIKATGAAEQKGIKRMLVKIDFVNGDILDYYRHLAQAIAI